MTGAAGFIGSRLAECLTGAYEAEVHALVRRVGTAGTARVARLSGVRLFHGDVRDPAAVRAAAAGCAYVVHCVTGTPGSYRQQKAEEVAGTSNVLDAAVREGSARAVYFSSAAVHDPAQSGDEIREESPLNGKVLGWRKMIAEGLVASYRERHGLPTVVLRPTSVWGPFSPIWTASAAELIVKGIPFLPAGGRGTANAVYIDNLVDAVYLALIKPDAVGEVFLINDDEPRTWGELYGGYARFLGVPLPVTEDASGVWDLLRVSGHNAGLILRNTMTGRTGRGISAIGQVYDHVPLVKACVSLLPEAVQQRLRKYGARREGSPDPGFLPYRLVPRGMRALYGSTSRYGTAKAKRVLGWRPRVSFPKALAVTCQWLQYAGYRNGTAAGG